MCFWSTAVRDGTPKRPGQGCAPTPDSIVQTHHSYRFFCWATERGIGYAAEVTWPVLESCQRYLYQYRKPNGEPLTSRTQRTTLQPLQVWFS